MSLSIWRFAISIAVAGSMLVRPLSFVQADAPKDAAPGFQVRETFELHYHPDDERQVLDVFSPKGAKDCPVMIFVHGGAWMFGDKNLFGLYRGVGKYLAKNGVVTVLINYRLSPTVKHPEHTRDLARAYAWVRKNITKYGGDPERIFLGGHSAGGHMVALLATDDDFWKDKTLGLKPADRASLKGVVAISGVYRIPGSNERTAMIAEMLGGVRDNGGTSPMPPRSLRGMQRGQDFRLFQVVFGDDPKVRADASPINHVRKGLPPFLILNAERELPTLPEMAHAFTKALKAAGNQVEEQRIPNCHHNGILFKLNEKDDPTAKALLDFLDRNTSRPLPPKVIKGGAS